MLSVKTKGEHRQTIRPVVGRKPLVVGPEPEFAETLLATSLPEAAAKFELCGGSSQDVANNVSTACVVITPTFDDERPTLRCPGSPS
jgi:hypothetical protein